MRHNIYTDIQRLEKRITDFTDVWHPIMTENMNRIKAELETTIKQTEREDINNIQSELEVRMKQIIEDNEANKLTRLLIGITQDKGLKLKLSKITNCYNNENSWNNSKTFNICDIYNRGITIIDDNNNVIVSGIDNNGNKVSCEHYNLWKIMLEEGIYEIWKYLTEKCSEIKLIVFSREIYGAIKFPIDSLNGDIYSKYTKKSVEQVMENRKQFINWYKNGGPFPNC